MLEIDLKNSNFEMTTVNLLLHLPARGTRFAGNFDLLILACIVKLRDLIDL